MHASFVYFHFPSDDHYTYAEDAQPRLFKSLAELESKRGFLIAPFSVCPASPYVLLDLEKAEKRSLTNLQHFQAKENSASSVDEDGGWQKTLGEARADYHAAFSKAMKALKSGDCRKIVLSHTLAEDFGQNLQECPEKLFLTAATLYPNRYVALWHTPHFGTWLTTSPELLLSGKTPQWRTMALAATKAAQDTKQWNEKELLEHQLVVQYIKDCIAPHACDMKVSPLCELEAGNVKHLLTHFHFCAPQSFRPSHLLQFLHPTPATCGLPQDAALRLLASIEPHQRECYAGYSGLLGKADCQLYVTLRCAKIQEERLTLYAGGGLLAESDETAEWEEILKKFQSIKRCLRGM